MLNPVSEKTPRNKNNKTVKHYCQSFLVQIYASCLFQNVGLLALGRPKVLFKPRKSASMTARGVLPAA